MSGRSEDIADLIRAAWPGCEVEDLSTRTSIIALQGPNSLQALAGLTDTGALGQLSYFAFVPVGIADVPCLVGRLGYTGEPGFEILLPRPAAPQLWALLARRARPAGFAAADMLRIEAGFVLFANEFRLPDGTRGRPRALRRLLRCDEGAGDRAGLLSGRHAQEAGAVAAANAPRSSDEVANDHRHFGLSQLAGRRHAGAGLCAAVRSNGGHAAA